MKLGKTLSKNMISAGDQLFPDPTGMVWIPDCISVSFPFYGKIGPYTFRLVKSLAEAGGQCMASMLVGSILAEILSGREKM